MLTTTEMIRTLLIYKALKKKKSLYKGPQISQKSRRTPQNSRGQTAHINPLKPKLNPICYLLALLGAHHFLHVSRIRVKLLTLR